MSKVFKIILDKDKNITANFEINDWAEKANISLSSNCGETLVLTTIVIGDKKEDLEFAPLTVDYVEKYYSVGKIYGSKFVRREGKASETAILNSRLIDRSLRPTIINFPFEIQITNLILSLDPEIDPDFLAFFNSSLGLYFLNITQEPALPIKISKIENNFIFYPFQSQKLLADFNLFISVFKNKINMIEFEGKEIDEKDFLLGCSLCLNKYQEIFNQIKYIKKDFNITANIQTFETINEEIYLNAAQDFIENNKLNLKEILFANKEGDKNLNDLFFLLEEKKDKLENYNLVYQGIWRKLKKILQEEIIKNEIRPDGRKFDEIRNIEILVDVLPRAHGSALFKRGLTHVLSVVTLGFLSDELWIREIEFEGYKRFMHQYNFPPFATGEIGSSLKQPSRREIGHGNLAEKALKNLIPSEEEFPYTIRVVSDVLSSNGSTSMASVCASSLALFDAGVNLKNHVSGISCGLAYINENNYKILVDIQGPEDFFGGMDFKVARTKKGITAIQLDVKIEGLNMEIIEETLEKAKNANIFILEKMIDKISIPRKQFKIGVPYVKSLKINQNKIGLLIGPGGKNINEIISQTNTKIDIRPDGSLYIYGENDDLVNKAEKLIKLSIDEIKEGEIVFGRVSKELPFGFIIDFGVNNKSALLHKSEIPESYIDKIKIDDVLKIKIKEINNEGRIYVSLENVS
jgi:polyribonucleotide nucleotidyltransferase